MAEITVRALQWGSSVGLRIRKADADRLGIAVGQELRIDVPDFRVPHDLSHWPAIDLGGRASEDHEDGFEAL